MRAKIEQACAGWARGGGPWPAAPAVDAAAKTRSGIYLINKDDVNQSTGLMGRLSGRVDDPDYAALSVMNGLLGDGFAPRLFLQVRREPALAYRVAPLWSGQ